jgi:hypothetical protein
MALRYCMKHTSRKSASAVAALILLALAPGIEAATLSLSPGMEVCTTTNNSNLKNSQMVIDVLESCGLTPPDPLELFYKADQGGDTHQGSYGSSYDAAFLNTPTDPEDAAINYLSGPTIDCTVCYLIVKDGNSLPAQYLFDISNWDRVSTIELTDFWLGRGAISNVAIWGDTRAVPEPASLMLFGAALGLAAVKRRRLA